MSGPREPQASQFGGRAPSEDPELSIYELIGASARAAGTDQFQSCILSLIGRVVAHDYLWAVRYGKETETDVFETRVIEQGLVEEYKARYHEDDPFGHYWRKRQISGVVTSEQAFDNSAASLRYQRDFQRRAKIRDELGVLLPIPGDACFGLFLESRGEFSRQQKDKLHEATPMIEGLHYAHVAKLLSQDNKEARQVYDTELLSPVLIVDRNRRVVHKNASWLEAELLLPDLRDLTGSAEAGQSGVLTGDRFALKFQVLDESFTIAPGGQIFILNWYATGQVAADFEPSVVASSVPVLTRLETDILRLIQYSNSSGEIAGALQISKETVKKYKLRLYRKFAVNSERLLVAKLRELTAAPGSRAGAVSPPPADQFPSVNAKTPHE